MNLVKQGLEIIEVIHLILRAPIVERKEGKDSPTV